MPIIGIGTARSSPFSPSPSSGRLVILIFKPKPVADHLALKQERNPLVHLIHTLSERRYWLAFILVMLMPTGGYMLFATRRYGLYRQQCRVDV